MTAKADTRLRRIPEKARHDLQLAYDIIDEAWICHLGFTLDDQPYVVPMALARDDDHILLHGSVASRLVKNLSAGLPCCLTITHLDGLVLARSAFNSSMHYRSMMVFGTARVISDPESKKRGFDILTESLLPGRLPDLRESTRQEINATTLLSLPLETYSIKVSDDPPDDKKSDLDAGIWAGVLPLSIVAGEPEPAPDLAEGIPMPDYL